MKKKPPPPPPPQFDLFDDGAAARRARDKALARVEKNERRDWFIRAKIAVRRIERHWEGTGEDIRLMLTHDGMPPPHHHNVWGALCNQCAQAGWIEKTGKRRNMKTKKSHARPTDIYRRTPQA